MKHSPNEQYLQEIHDTAYRLNKVYEALLVAVKHSKNQHMLQSQLHELEQHMQNVRIDMLRTNYMLKASKNKNK